MDCRSNGLSDAKKATILKILWTFTMKKRCFATGLATQFLNCKGHLQFTIYMVQLIATQLQLSQNNSFSITMQLHYNCTYDVMLMSLIIIHLLKIDMWHYEDFWT